MSILLIIVNSNYSIYLFENDYLVFRNVLHFFSNWKTLMIPFCKGYNAWCKVVRVIYLLSFLKKLHISSIAIAYAC